MIDLDQYNDETYGRTSFTPRRSGVRHKTVLRLIAAFVAGIMLGGVGANELRDSSDRRERTTSIALVAIPATVGKGGSHSPGNVELNGMLALINAGAAQITVRGVAAKGPNVLITGTGQSQLIRPGGTVWIEVRVRFDCSIPIDYGPLSMRFLVDTDDKQTRTISYPVALLGSVWHRVAEPICEHRG